MLLFVLSLGAFLASGQGMSHADYAKLALAQTVAMLMCVAYLLPSGKECRDEDTPSSAVSSAAMLALAALAWASIAWAKDQHATYGRALALTSYVGIAVLGGAVLKTERGWLAGCAAVAAPGLAAALAGIGAGLWEQAAAWRPVQVRAYLPTVSQPSFAAALLVPMGMACGILAEAVRCRVSRAAGIDPPSTRFTWAVTAAAGLILIALVLARSRIGFACAAAVLVLTLLASLPRPFRLAVGIALAVGTVGAGAAAMSSFAPESKAWLSSPPMSLRYLPWTFAWRIFAANPILGAGAGAFPGEASLLRDGPSYLALATEDLPWRTESLPLEIAAELGGIGLLLLLVGTAAPWAATYGALDRKCAGAPRGLLLGLWAGYGGLWLHSLVAGGTDRYAENALLFPSLGLLLAAGRLYRADLGAAAAAAATRAAPREAERGRWAWPAAGTAVAAAVWAAAVLPGIRAELAVGEAARMLKGAGRPEAGSAGTDGGAARAECETAGRLALTAMLMPAVQPRTAAAAARVRVKALRTAGRLGEAVREAAKWAERHEGWLWMLKQHGALALEAGRPSEALAAFVRAAKANPFDAEIQKGMMAALAEGTLACAAARIEEATAGVGGPDPGGGDGKYLEAMALLARNSPEQARRILTTCSAGEVSIGSVWLLRARCLLAMGADKATEAFQEIQVHKSAYPLDPEAYWMQADAIEAMGRFEHQDSVVESLQRYIELRPGRTAAILRLAGIEVQRGNAAAAVPRLEDAVSRGTSDRRIYSWLAAIYRSGVFSDRLDALIEIAARRFPGDGPFLNSLRGGSAGDAGSSAPPGRSPSDRPSAEPPSDERPPSEQP